MSKKLTFQEIPLDKIDIEKSQMRVRDTGLGIDELAENIRINGLHQPIMLAPASKNGRYEIIAGQRRYLAHIKLKELGQLQPESIRALIFKEKINESEAKIVSLTENIMRLQPHQDDYIDICTDLYKKYGSIKSVSEKTGIPASAVGRYVKYPQLRKGLKKLVDEGMKIATALHANSAVIDETEEGEKKAIELAIELSKMGASQVRRATKIVTENPKATVKQAVTQAETQIEHLIKVSTSPREHAALQGYAEQTGQSKEEAASEILVDGLVSIGALDEED